MYELLWQYQKRKIQRFFEVRRAAKIITIALFMLVFAFVAFGIHEFFIAGFTIIASTQFFTKALTLYVYEAYTLVTMLLVLFSASITALFSLFRAKENEWILTTPKFRLIPNSVLINVFLSSLWPLLIIFLPGLIAVANVFGISALGFIMSLLSIALLTLFIVVLVFVIIMLIAKLLHLLSRALASNIFSLRNLVIVTLVVIALLSFLAWRGGFTLDLVKLFHAEDPKAVTPSITVIQDKFSLYPTHSVAGAIYHWQQGDTSSALTLLATLCVILIIAGILWRLTNAWFLQLWQNLQRGSYIATTSSETKIRHGGKYHFRGGYINALFKKEALVSLRNGRNISWFSFLAFIWLLQVGLNIVLSKSIAEHELGTAAYTSVIQALQFATAVFFISAFVLRFVFPAFSSERKTAWILATAPIRMRKVFWSKLIFYLIIFTGVGLLIGYANLAFLGQPLQSVGITLLLFITALPLLIIYGLTLGALFPNFETDDPSALSTSLPGFAFIIGSLGYGALGGWLLYSYLNGGTILPIILFELVSIGLGTLLLSIGPRSLEKISFVKEIE